MSERRDIAEDLVEAVRKEAVGEVAKGVVKGVKAVLVTALAAICALVWSLWTASPVATVALAVVSLAFGMAVGASVSWRRAVSAKDAEITELEADLGARNRADAERARLRETFVRGIDPEQQEVMAYFSNFTYIEKRKGVTDGAWV